MKQKEICAFQPQTAFNKELYYIEVLEAELNTKMPYRSLEEDKFYKAEYMKEFGQAGSPDPDISEINKQFWLYDKENKYIIGATIMK
jgi:hypothetical protein